MDIDTLHAQETRLVFARFDETTALVLGQALVKLAQAGALPVVIDIRTPDRPLFYAALPGSAPLNALWARRKSATCLMFQAASLLVGMRLRAKGDSLDKHGLASADYASSGGSFPLRVSGAGVVGAVTVSGLTEVEDHALVVAGLENLLGT